MSMAGVSKVPSDDVMLTSGSRAPWLMRSGDMRPVRRLWGRNEGSGPAERCCTLARRAEVVEVAGRVPEAEVLRVLGALPRWP